MGIVARVRRVGAAAVVAVIVGTLAPSVAVGQATYRLACDLLLDAAASELLGADVVAAREGSRASCTYKAGNSEPLRIRLDHRDSLASHSQVKPTTVAGLPTISGTSSEGGAAIAEFPDGGTLSVEVDRKGARPKADEKTAKEVLEAILATGPVTAQPPERGDPEPLYLAEPMCKTLTNEMVDELVGGSNEGTDPGNDLQCGYLPSGLTVYLAPDDFKSVDLGDYGSEELTVDERPARWDGVEQQLSVDAGSGRVLAIDLVGQETVDESRETTLAVAETLLPLLSTEPPPLPAECPLPLDVVGGLTGLQTDSVAASGMTCSYVDATRPRSGVTVIQDSAADPKALAERYGVPGRLKKVDVAGQPALALEVDGAAILMVDLDGLPDGDGQVLMVQLGGLPDGFEPTAVAMALADAIIAAM
jgi:hypothetical protein